MSYRNRTKYNKPKIDVIRNIANSKRFNVDIICLQELHTSQNQTFHNFFPFGNPKQENGFRMRAHTASDQLADGIMTFIKNKITCTENDVLVEGRLTYLRLKHKDFPNEINVYNIYNHVSNREDEALAVLTVLEQHVFDTVNGPGGDIYIAGDFNIPLSADPYPPQAGSTYSSHSSVYSQK